MSLRFAFVWFGLAAGTVWGQTSGMTSLSLVVPAQASITIANATTTLTSSSVLAPFTGITNFTFSIVTSQSTGAGSIQLQITTDFAPAGGPSLTTPLTAGDKLTFTCGATAAGTACSGTQTASTTAQIPIVTFGADVHATNMAGLVNWSLTDDPAYKSGTYNATATFTISAT